MDARFEQCLSHVLRHEGGYVDHPQDPGGATNMGITRRTLAEWRKVTPWTNLPKVAVQILEPDEAAAIYRTRYWNVCAAGKMPAGLDLALFDFAVNSGPVRAVSHLQDLVGADIDGICGPRTLAAVSRSREKIGAGNLASALCDSRLDFLRTLDSFRTFGRGWTRRVSDIREQALLDAAKSRPSQTNRRNPMNILPGFKTYIIAAAMLIAGLAQVLGVDLPGFDNQSAMHLIMEAMGLMFLRRGVTSGTGS